MQIPPLSLPARGTSSDGTPTKESMDGEKRKEGIWKGRKKEEDGREYGERSNHSRRNRTALSEAVLLPPKGGTSNCQIIKHEGILGYFPSDPEFELRSLT